VIEKRTTLRNGGCFFINTNKEVLMELLLGAVFFVVGFVTGTLIGGPLWKRIVSKLPWNK